MSGAGKKVVDAAAKAVSAVKSKGGIDWDGMAKLIVSDEAKKEFANLRHALDEVNHTLQTKFRQITLLVIKGANSNAASGETENGEAVPVDATPAVGKTTSVSGDTPIGNLGGNEAAVSVDANLLSAKPHM